MRNSILSNICFCCGWFSIIGSIGAWFSVDQNSGIFIGLWSVNFFVLSNRFSDD